MPFPLHQIEQPTLLLDEDRCKANIQRMVQKMHGLRFRPHAKTHQSAVVASWFREAGVDSLTVSSADMASHFIDAGWKSLTLAFPVNPRQIDRLLSLRQQAELDLVVDHPAALAALNQETDSPIPLWIKLNMGNNRAGIAPGSTEQIRRLVSEITSYPKLHFKGFLGHAGQSYGARSLPEIKGVHETYLQAVASLKVAYPQAQFSMGDSPTCSTMDHFPGVDELRPGVFVFYDLMQANIGACNLNNIALCMACPVVSVYPERDEVLIHGGAIHFSKERETHFGLPVRLTEQGWGEPIPGLRLDRISQEHGIIAGPGAAAAFQPGDLVGILPYHACLTANLMKRYLTSNGKWIEQMSTFT